MSQVCVTGFGWVEQEDFDKAMETYKRVFADLAGKNANGRMADTFKAFSEHMTRLGYKYQVGKE